MADAAEIRVLGVIVVDFERSAIGTRSRLADLFAGKRVIDHVLERLLQVRGVGEVAILVPTEQMARAQNLARPNVHILELERRSAIMDMRVRRGRAWNLAAWRGGAGQWNVFDEEYHPKAIAGACAAAFHGEPATAKESNRRAAGSGAEHVLIVHSHGVFLDVLINSALVHHHLHKNHEMRVTYTPAAPGLSGMLLRADIVAEMGRNGVLPSHLLAYDPKSPTFDTLIREACMQVDPALTKIPNRFCVDTERSWRICESLAHRARDVEPGAGMESGPAWESAAELALAAAREVAPGVRDHSQRYSWPREVEIELTARRLTSPPGALPAELCDSRGELAPAHWTQWLARQSLCDDLLVIIAGDGDPLLYPHLRPVLQAVRAAGALAICVQTDLASASIDPLLECVRDGLIDVLSVTMYGHTAETYARVAGAPLHATVMKNMERLSAAITGATSGAEGGAATGEQKARGMPLVVPRLLKVRDTIPEMEPFFDFWVERCGWAVIDAPSDRAGAIPFAAVVDMAPPKRRPCRRLWERMLIRADGQAAACDQDIAGRLRIGSIESMSLPQLWQALHPLRDQHAAGQWNLLSPCSTCREWHRA